MHARAVAVVVEAEDHRLWRWLTKVATLADLRAVHRRIKERGLPIKVAHNHGCSLAFYFDDPEGNLIEVYWATNVHNRQPYGDPLRVTELISSVKARTSRDVVSR
jgi:catechol-2,3-dioxygenase